MALEDDFKELLGEQPAAAAVTEAEAAEEQRILMMNAVGSWLSQHLREDAAFNHSINAVLALRNGLNCMMRGILVYAGNCKEPLTWEQQSYLLPCLQQIVAEMTETNADPACVIPGLQNHVVPQLQQFDQMLWQLRQQETLALPGCTLLATRDTPVCLLGTAAALAEFTKQLSLQLQSEVNKPLMTLWLGRDPAHNDRVCNNRARILQVGCHVWQGLLTKPDHLQVFIRTNQAKLAREVDLIVGESAQGLAAVASPQGLCRQVKKFSKHLHGRLPWQIYCWQTEDTGLKLPTAEALPGIQALYVTVSAEGQLVVVPLP